jgi:hypothetical protein
VKYRRLATLCAGFGTVGLGVMITIANADGNGPPTQTQIDFAKGTSDLMTNTVIAALVQEINETTPQNATQGDLSISLVFNDRNRDMRLVGTLQPLAANDLPADKFERDALALAMTGQADTSVEKVDDRWYYRRSIPLSNFAPQCQMCHANFASLSSSTWVGALMLRVPIQ